MSAAQPTPDMRENAVTEYQNPLPPLPLPEMSPQRAVASMPTISAEAYQHVGRYAGAIVMACFEQIGGLSMFADWASQNRTDFYTKMFAKTVQRSTQVDVSGSVTIDDAITQLERQRDQPLLADYSEVVEDAVFFDL